MTQTPATLLLTRGDIMRIMTAADYLVAADEVFAAAAAGKASSPQPMHLPAKRGGFHAKGACLSRERDYVAVKINGNFPANPAELGRPTIQGVIFLADASNGDILAILDSIEVTLRRTAAASALAARRLAKPESHVLLVCGCGEQGRAHAVALREVMPLKRLLLWDRNREAAETLASDLTSATQIDAIAVTELPDASRSADVIATCTTAREPFLGPGLVAPGTFIAAVGADNPDKSEIAPSLMATATVVADVVEQCAVMGDLHHAIEARLMSKEDVYAELTEVVAGAKGRRSPEEIIIFDSTGTGLLDVASAAAIYRRCASVTDIRSIELAEG